MPPPTGKPLRDVREQLFAAAERVLRRDGPTALTSRAVTTEAGCAKGVLHRHFSDFDGFLAELITDRIFHVEKQTGALVARAGERTVVANLTDALGALFGPLTVAVIGLVIFRDGLRDRLRRQRPGGLPLLTEAVAGIADYLTAETTAGRVASETDVSALAANLVGTAHLLYADRTAPPPARSAVERAVATALIGTVLPCPR